MEFAGEFGGEGI